MNISDSIQLGIMLITAIALFSSVNGFRKQLQLNFFAEYTKRYQEIILNFPETINQADFSFDELAEEVRAKTLRYMRAYFDLCSEEYFLWKSKHIDTKVWKEWDSGIKYAFSKKAFRDGWDRVQMDTIYYEEFAEYVKKHIKAYPQ